MDTEQTACKGSLTADNTRHLTAADLNESFFRNLAASMFWLMRREKKYSYGYALFKGHFHANRHAARVLSK